MFLAMDVSMVLVDGYSNWEKVDPYLFKVLCIEVWLRLKCTIGVRF